MKCLENIIGLRGVCENAKYLCYINDDIPLKMFSSLANSEDFSGKKFFERLRRKAADRVASDFLDELDSTYQWNTVIKSEIDGLWDFNNLDCLTCKNGLVGRRIYKKCTDPYLSPQVTNIKINSKTEVEEFTLFIRQNGCDVEEQCISLKCGVNEIPINITDEFIEIYFDCKGLEIYRAKDYDCGCNYKCCCGECYEIENIKQNEFSEWESFDEIPFQVSVNCVCTSDVLVCQYASQLKEVLRLYLTAVYWEEFEITLRKNEVANNKVDAAQMQYYKIMGGVNPATGDVIEKRHTKYYPKLWKVVKRVQGSIKQSRCIECRGFRIIESI